MLWTFAKDTGLLGDKPGVNPVLEVPNKKPVITQRTPGTDSAFTLPELEKIYKDKNIKTLDISTKLYEIFNQKEMRDRVINTLISRPEILEKYQQNP